MGLVLLVAGVALVALVTPLDNVVAEQFGAHTVRVAGVPAGQTSSYPLSGEGRLLRQASSFDVRVSFMMRLTQDTVKEPAQMVSTLTGHQGMVFELSAPRELIGIVGGVPGFVDPVARVLTSSVPLGQWVAVTGEVQHNQSLRYKVDGSTVQSFTWNVPIWDAAPTMLQVKGSDGVSIRDLSLVVTLYRTTSTLHLILVRAGQVIGILAIIGGTVLLLRRFLAGLMPVARGVRRPLVRVAFGTMGLGIIVNLGIDIGHFQRSSIPYYERNSWLLAQYPRFNDFFQVYEIFRSMNPYGVQEGSYPPVGYWLVAPVAWLGEYAALFVFLAVMIGFMLWWFSRSFAPDGRTIERVAIVTVAMLSLPVTFAVDRANVDLILFVMLVFGIAALERKYGMLAGTWLGLMAATKAIPVLYLLLFLRGRRLRYLVAGLAVAILITLLALLGLHGGLTTNIDGFRTAESALQSQLNTALQSTSYNASLYGWLQGIGFATGGAHGAQAVRDAVAPLITPVEIVGALALAGYLRWSERSLWRAVSLITLVMILLTGSSDYYILLLLFVPLALFVKHAEVNTHRLVIAGLFGLVLAPRAYFYLGYFIDISVLSTAPILLAMTGLILYDGIRTRRTMSSPFLDNSAIQAALSDANVHG